MCQGLLLIIESFTCKTLYWDGQLQCSMLTVEFFKNVIVDEETGRENLY